MADTFRITIPAGTKFQIPSKAKCDMGIGIPGGKNEDVLKQTPNQHLDERIIGGPKYDAKNGPIVLNGIPENEMKGFKPFEKSHGVKIEKE